MQRLMEIVDGRNAIVVGLDEDRLRSENAARLKTNEILKSHKSVVFIREVEEDQQLNEMMKNLGEQPSDPHNASFQRFPNIFLRCILCMC